MSGGIAYVYDDQGDFSTRRCNKASVDLEPLVDSRRHRPRSAPCSSAIAISPAARAPHGSSSTGPTRSRSFIKVFPHEYKRVLGVARAEAVYALSQTLVAPGDGSTAEVQHG